MSAGAWPLTGTPGFEPRPDPNQLKLPWAVRAAQWFAEQRQVQDDRVVTTATSCRNDGCTRSAGADGLCTSCRMDHNGAAIEGRRL